MPENVPDNKKVNKEHDIEKLIKETNDALEMLIDYLGFSKEECLKVLDAFIMDYENGVSSVPLYLNTEKYERFLKVSNLVKMLADDEDTIEEDIVPCHYHGSIILTSGYIWWSIEKLSLLSQILQLADNVFIDWCPNETFKVCFRISNLYFDIDDVVSN